MSRTNVASVAEADPPPREIKPAAENDVVVAEHRRVVFHYRLAPGADLYDTIIPDFWADAAPKLHRGALIEIEPPDASFWALLLVRECGRDFARCALLQRVDLPALHPPTQDDLPLGHTVQFLGPKRKWCAMRGTQVLKHGFTDKGSACAWLVETTRG